MDNPEVDTSSAAIAKERLEQESLPYRWKQTLDDVTVTVALPPGTRARDLKVLVLKNKLFVQQLREQAPAIDDALYSAIDECESTWSVVDAKELEITLVKLKQEWWPHVVQGAPKIDTRRIAPESSSLGELDSETRATVEKMMWEQRERQARDFAKKSAVRSDVSTAGTAGTAETTVSTEEKLRALERFKEQHPELDFSQLDERNIQGI